MSTRRVGVVAQVFFFLFEDIFLQHKAMTNDLQAPSVTSYTIFFGFQSYVHLYYMHNTSQKAKRPHVLYSAI